MPPSSSLSMINEDTVLMDRSFADHTSGLAKSLRSSYGQGHAQSTDSSEHQSISSKVQSSTDASTTGSNRQPQYSFQPSPRETTEIMSTPGVRIDSTPSPTASPSPMSSQAPSAVPDISRLAQSRYARAVQYANFRKAHDTLPHASHAVPPSGTSSVQELSVSDSPPPKTLTSTIITTTRPLKPPSHSASPRVPPPRIKRETPAPVTPPTPPLSAPSRSMPSSASSVASTSNATNTTDSNTNSFAQSSADALEWRKHGKRVRAMLLLEDEEKGGSTFQLTNTCSIQRYYRVAERVLEKFLSTSIRNNVNELELAESYLVGNRLVKFLSIVLPTHEQYFSKDPNLQVLRKRSQEQLVQLLRYLEEIALVMDELQYNSYILRDLTPEEQTMVKGLTSGGGGSGVETDLVVAYGTPNEPTSTVNAPINSTRSTTPSLRPTMDRTRSSPTNDFITSPPTSTPWPDCGKDLFQERVAQVIQMTEAFSDTYESTMEGKPEAAPHLFLKRTLMAAAAEAGDETSTASRRLATTIPTPSIRNAPTITPNINETKQQQPGQRATSPTLSELSDPSLLTLSSLESEENHPIHHRNAQQHMDTHARLWNGVGGDFGSESRGRELQSDHMNDRWNQIARAKYGSNNNATNNSIPRLKQPKSHPTRSERARAAAAVQYDQLFTQSQPTLKYSTGTKGRHEITNYGTKPNYNKKDTPLPPPSDAGMEESPLLFKTRIEDRLERASVVQRELRQHELRKSQMNSQRWRTRKAEDRTPLKAMPLEDHGDDNSLLADKPKEVMTNQNILRHFRGCVQCMLD